MKNELTYQGKNGEAMGRNGMIKVSGIEFMSLDHSNAVMLTPINSKGKLANACFIIPNEDIPAVITELEKFAPKVNRFERRGSMIYTCEDEPGKAKFIADCGTVSAAYLMLKRLNEAFNS